MSNYTQLPLPLPDATIEIPLTHGQVAIVDVTDVDLALFKWNAQRTNKYGDTPIYAARRDLPTVRGKRSSVRMHRVILARMLGRELTRQEEVDHIDLNPLNNRRSNLRLADRSQNCANKRLQSTSASGYKGVSWHIQHKKWAAKIKHNGKTIHIGYFDDPAKAHEKYCAKAVELFGEFARFN